MLKDMKINTKLISGFVIIDILVVILVYCGYSTCCKFVEGVSNPERYLKNYGIFITVTMLLLVAVMAFISIGVTRSIRLSVENLKKAADSLAEGDCETKLVKVCNDELGSLIDEFEKVIDNMRYQAGIAKKVSDGDLTVDVKVRSEKDLLGRALRHLVESNYNAVSSVHDAAYQVMTSSSQVASASEALAQGSTEQASAIEQITSSIDEIAGKTRENATEADKAAGLMSSAIESVEKGKEDMQEMMRAMQEINASSESISKIIKVIDDIAFQTNILALNAAVEAARAGEAGKGFAVVAEEVRNLAAKSAAAASETAELIEDSIAKVEAGSKIADETAQAIQLITDVVLESGRIVEGIATASNYQATAIEQVDQAFELVSQVVQNNSATSQECAAASIELSNQSGKMTELLSVYDLGNGANKSVAKPVTADFSRTNRNEQIISLGSGFGKY